MSLMHFCMWALAKQLALETFDLDGDFLPGGINPSINEGASDAGEEGRGGCSEGKRDKTLSSRA